MDKPSRPVHVKLFAFDLCSLHRTQSQFGLHGPFSRAEMVGVIVSRELKPDRFLKFTVDDGTGCIPCILWLNHLSSRYFARWNPDKLRVAHEFANSLASHVSIGALARVRGKITRYRGAVQITVSNLVPERDPNAEILHWLDCIKLGRTVYGRCHQRRMVNV